VAADVSALAIAVGEAAWQRGFEVDMMGANCDGVQQPLPSAR
jgi:hypothetical protein